MNNIKQEVKSSLPMLLLLITADARRRVKRMLQKSSGATSTSSCGDAASGAPGNRAVCFLPIPVSK